MKRSLFGLACVCAVSGFAAVACEPEAQRDLIECGDPAGQLDPALVQTTCTTKCGIKGCRNASPDEKSCLEDCKRKAAFASGALWLIWQECRVGNSCDQVFEVEKCQAFKDNYERCYCGNLAQLKIDGHPGCGDLPLGSCSDASVEQCVRLGLAPDVCSDPPLDESQSDCEDACSRACELDPLPLHRDECLKLLVDVECGEKWSAYGDCLVTADCDSTKCEEQALAWEQCPDGPAASGKLEAGCRAKCKEEDCRGPGSDETTCLSECKSEGEKDCGAYWLTWQECRVTHQCDGLFENDECAKVKSDYMECACELEPMPPSCPEGIRMTHSAHVLRGQGRAIASEEGAIHE